MRNSLRRKSSTEKLKYNFANGLNELKVRKKMLMV